MLFRSVELHTGSTFGGEAFAWNELGYCSRQRWKIGEWIMRKPTMHSEVLRKALGDGADFIRNLLVLVYHLGVSRHKAVFGSHHAKIGPEIRV